MNIEKILSTKERIKILEGIIYKTEPIQVNKTSKTLKISKGLISKYFTILRKEGIMKKSKPKSKKKAPKKSKKRLLKIFLTEKQTSFVQLQLVKKVLTSRKLIP